MLRLPVAPYHRVRMASIANNLRTEKGLELLGNTERYIGKVVNATAILISNCYGFETNDTTDCRINLWYQKTSKSRKYTPLLQTIPLMHETFR